MIREKVLHELEINRGKRISGGKLAKELGVSRAGVWKAISALRSEGMDIVSVTGGGYMLNDTDDTLTAQSIHALTKNKVIGNSILVFKEVTSTNTVLRNEYSHNEHGFTVVAESQTAGKGRMGRKFISPDGGVYTSILLRPNITLEKIGFITILTAVATCKAIERCCKISPKIKWVNDLLIDGKKVCGILTEASIEGETSNIEYVIVGIGVNVHTDISKMPEDIKCIAGSLSQFCDKTPRRAQIVSAILEEFEDGYNILCGENGESEILKLYEERLCCINETVEVYSASEKYDAVCKGINSAGNLIVEKADGTLSALQSGEIRIRTK